MQIIVRDNNVDQALRALKSLHEHDGAALDGAGPPGGF